MAFNNAVNANQTGVQCLTSAGVWNGRTITAGTGISVADGDGVSGNPTISATGSHPSTSKIYIVDDFLGLASESGGNGNTNLIFPTALNGDIAYLTSPSTAHPGVVSITSVGGSGGRAVLMTNDFILGDGAATVKWIMRIPTLSDGTNTFYVYNGFMDDDFTISYGAFFSYNSTLNSGKWQIVTINGGAANTVNTNTTADTNWHEYMITVNSAASSISYYIDGVEVSGSPISTSIPTSPVKAYGCIHKTAGSTDRSLYIDYMSLDKDVTASRY